MFKLTRHGHKGWTEKVLYNFCPSQSACPDGEDPNSRLTYTGAANGDPYDGVSPLFGTTFLGGGAGNGVVFESKPKNRQRKWLQSVVYAFCARSGCTDGSTPNSVVADGAGNLIGNAVHGGDANGGTVFELTPHGRGWNEKTLYSFCAAAHCKDGQGPAGPLLIDQQGDLFGTTATGGDKNEGVIFKLAPGDGGYAQSILYSFCIGHKCSDGSAPVDGVAMDETGNLPGFASRGGTGFHAGTIFPFNGSLNVLYQFCPNSSCPDGFIPHGTPILDASGDIYGITAGGGAHNHGEIFELTP